MQLSETQKKLSLFAFPAITGVAVVLAGSLFLKGDFTLSAKDQDRLPGAESNPLTHILEGMERARQRPPAVHLPVRDINLFIG